MRVPFREYSFAYARDSTRQSLFSITVIPLLPEESVGLTITGNLISEKSIF